MFFLHRPPKSGCIRPKRSWQLLLHVPELKLCSNVLLNDRFTAESHLYMQLSYHLIITSKYKLIKAKLKPKLHKVLAFIPHHMEVAIMPWFSLLEFHSSTSSINGYTAMSLSNLYQKSKNCFPFRFMGTDNRKWTH